MFVIFDCDGVLVDTEAISCGCFAAALAREGLDWNLDKTMRRLMGRPAAACVQIVEAEAGRALPPDFLERLQAETFQAFLEAPVRVVDGVQDVLDTLRQKGIAYCVASSGKVEKMRLTLGLTGLLPYFEGQMFSASMVARGKPWPDLFLHAAGQMDQSPVSCVVVEDSVAGVQAARAAGMRVLAYCGAPYADPELLAEEGGEPFTDMRDLSRLLFDAA